MRAGLSGRALLDFDGEMASSPGLNRGSQRTSSASHRTYEGTSGAVSGPPTSTGVGMVLPSLGRATLSEHVEAVRRPAAPCDRRFSLRLKAEVLRCGWVDGPTGERCPTGENPVNALHSAPDVPIFNPCSPMGLTIS